MERLLLKENTEIEAIDVVHLLYGMEIFMSEDEIDIRVIDKLAEYTKEYLADK